MTHSTGQWTYRYGVHDPGKEITQLGKDFSVVNDDESGEQPAGWSRKTGSATGKSYYVHDCDPNQGFWHSVPIQQIEMSAVINLKPPYLHTNNTRTARLPIRKISNTHRISQCCCAILGRPAACESWAGILRLNETLDEHTTQEGDVCELIELSMGRVRGYDCEAVSFDEWDLPECPSQKNGLYGFYNVMWIERVDGIAYRKALGRVERSVWDEVATERISVILG